MRIIKDNIEDLMNKTGHMYTPEFSDELLRSALNNWSLFDQKEEELLKLPDISLEDILYSKYYWFTMFMNRYHEVYEQNAGIDQQQFKLLEELSNRLESVDYKLLKDIEEDDNE